MERFLGLRRHLNHIFRILGQNWFSVYLPFTVVQMDYTGITQEFGYRPIQIPFWDKYSSSLVPNHHCSIKKTFVLTQTTLGKVKTMIGTIRNRFWGKKKSNVFFMCKKSLKVRYLVPSTQDLHRNQIYKIFFQIKKSWFRVWKCKINVGETFFRLFGKNH